MFAFNSGDELNLWYPAQAIIAALSVQNTGSGNQDLKPNFSHSEATASLNAPLAATPPVTTTRVRPSFLHAVIIFYERTSTTAS